MTDGRRNAAKDSTARRARPQPSVRAWPCCCQFPRPRQIAEARERARRRHRSIHAQGSLGAAGVAVIPSRVASMTTIPRQVPIPWQFGSAGPAGEALGPPARRWPAGEALGPPGCAPRSRRAPHKPEKVYVVGASPRIRSRASGERRRRRSAAVAVGVTGGIDTHDRGSQAPGRPRTGVEQGHRLGRPGNPGQPAAHDLAALLFLGAQCQGLPHRVRLTKSLTSWP